MHLRVESPSCSRLAHNASGRSGSGECTGFYAVCCWLFSYLKLTSFDVERSCRTDAAPGRCETTDAGMMNSCGNFCPRGYSVFIGRGLLAWDILPRFLGLATPLAETSLLSEGEDRLDHVPDYQGSDG